MTFVTMPDGGHLHIAASGDGPMLLCHAGGPGRAAAYLEDLGGLSATRTVTLIDARGTGGSELPEDPAALAFDALARDVVAVADHFGLGCFDLLAHSAGAIVAQQLVATEGERVNKLVLVCPTSRLQAHDFPDVAAIRALRSDEDWYPAAAQAMEALEAGFGGREVLELVAPFSYAQWGPRQQEHAATASEQHSRRAEEGFRGSGVDRPAILAGVAAFERPVLVVAGDRDGMTGVQSAHRVAQSFPNATVEVLRTAGHYPWVDQPERFRTVVEAFLER